MISDQRFDLDQVMLVFHREFISRIFENFVLAGNLSFYSNCAVWSLCPYRDICTFSLKDLDAFDNQHFVPSWQAVTHKSTKHNHKYTIFNEFSWFPNKRNPRHWEFKTSFQLLETLLLANPCLFHCISHIFLVFRQIIPDWHFCTWVWRKYKDRTKRSWTLLVLDLVLVELPGIFEYPSGSDHYEHYFEIPNKWCLS